MSLVQALPEGPLGIVGDIHGEYEALHGLLRHLGSNHAGQHSEGRQLVFVGDFFDRGPHSPRVFEKVRTLVDSGRAFAVLGNHEINLLRNDPKDGAGWFFESRTQKDQEKYAPFDVASAASRREIMRFLTTLPLALERPDLRVVHTAWLDTSIDAIRGHTTESLGSEFDRWQAAADQLIEQRQLRKQMGEEVLSWGHSLENPQHQPSGMPAHSDVDRFSRNSWIRRQAFHGRRGRPCGKRISIRRLRWQLHQMTSCWPSKTWASQNWRHPCGVLCSPDTR